MPLEFWEPPEYNGVMTQDTRLDQGWIEEKTLIEENFIDPVKLKDWRQGLGKGIQWDRARQKGGAVILAPEAATEAVNKFRGPEPDWVVQKIPTNPKLIVVNDSRGNQQRIRVASNKNFVRGFKIPSDRIKPTEVEGVFYLVGGLPRTNGRW